MATILEQLKGLGQTEAIKLIKQNANLIKSNPELQKQIASTYTQAFGPVPGTTTPVAPVAPVTPVTPVTPVAPVAPTPTVYPAPVPGNTMDTSTGAPYVAPNPLASKGFTYGTQSFTPDKESKFGIAYNSKGITDEDKYGITYNQKGDLFKYITNIRGKGLPETEISKLSSDYLKQLQSDNLNPSTYGKSYGSKPEGVPTDPTQAKGTIGSIVDLDGNGIPDAQEGFGLPDQNKPTEFKKLNTNPWGKEYAFDITDFTNLEKSFVDYSRDALTYETNQKNKAAAAYEAVTNENAKRIIDTNNAMIGNIQELLGERVQQNKEQYKDAVGSVYRQFGGQVKQFQRLIGSDGKAVDDATALALMGDTGVGAMSKIVDLKNTLVNQYLSQKDQAIQQIYALQKEGVVKSNEAASAVTAIRDQAEVDVIDMTKKFYEEMFGMNTKIDQRTEQTQSAIRSGVSQFLSAIGLTPIQQNQMLNNYIKEGYSVNDALTMLSDDIRNNRGPVLQYIDQNNQAAADAAKAAHEQKMQELTVPIITKGEVDLAILDDKQAFEAAQATLDRQLKARSSSYAKDKDKTAGETLRTNVSNSLTSAGGNPITAPITLGEVAIIFDAANHLANQNAVNIDYDPNSEKTKNAEIILKSKGITNTDSRTMTTLANNLKKGTVPFSTE